LGGPDVGLIDQRPFSINRFQFDQLPLTGGSNQHGAHLGHGGCLGALIS
jgi:hypothetical protein